MGQRSVKIFYPDPDTGSLIMGFNSAAPAQVTGVQVLLERIAKLLTTKVGSNLFSPEQGSALGQKQTFTSDNAVEVQIMVYSAVASVSEQIQREQYESTTALTPDQKLLSLEVSNIVQGSDPSTWYVEVLVVTGANETYFLTV